MRAASITLLAVLGLGLGLCMGCATDPGRTTYRDDPHNDVPPPNLPPSARERQPMAGDSWVAGSLSEEEAKRLGVKPAEEGEGEAKPADE